MSRKHIRKDPNRTKADHRPMLPEFRRPEDALDEAVRHARRRYDDLNPTERMKWR